MRKHKHVHIHVHTNIRVHTNAHTHTADIITYIDLHNIISRHDARHLCMLMLLDKIEALCT